MKIFHCQHCQQLVFYENTRCVSCNHLLAYLPDVAAMGALEPVGANAWRSIANQGDGPMYRLCQNYNRVNVCNWALTVEDGHPLCRSCRLSRTIPDVSQAGYAEAWYRLEVAKRRLLYHLLCLGLPVIGKDDDPAQGLAFDFLGFFAYPRERYSWTVFAAFRLSSFADGLPQKVRHKWILLRL
jgi:hypothetical protein